MPRYLVTWEIDIDADTPDAAAHEALRYQRDPRSGAVVFTVDDRNGSRVQVDLWEGD